MASEIVTFVSKLDKLISNESRKRVADAVGMEAKTQAQKAARVDLGGDAAFSGWKSKGGVMPLEARYQHHASNPGAITVHRAPKSAGPWDVAQSGRNTKAGPRMTGPRIGKRGKVLKQSKRRYNGRTKGKDTWDDAEVLIKRSAPDVAQKALNIELFKAMTGD